MTTSDDIAQRVQAASLDAVVELFELDATALGDQVYYFTAQSLIPDPLAPVPTNVTWQGHTYSPIPCEATGWEVNGKGTLPTPHLKVANVNLAFSGLAIGFNDLLGCKVTRHRTFKRYLDGQIEADPDAEFDPDVYRVDRKVAQNKIFVEWELASTMDQEGRLLPGRPVLQSACPFRYRHWNGSAFDYTNAQCPYVGTNYFDVSGAVVATPALDRAGKRFDTCCAKRFPTGAKPFGGFPGVARFQ